MKRLQNAARTDRKQGNIFDAFVKSMFGRVVIFADFLKNYARPRFLDQVDLQKIVPAPTHLFGKEIDERIVDLVFRCPIKHGGGSLLAVVIFEHQSNSLRDIPQKLLKYISAIWEAEKKGRKPLSAPYFIVLRTGKRPHRKPYPRMADRLPKDSNGESIGTVPEIEYEVVDLPAWDFDSLVGLPALRLVMGMLKKMSEGALDDFADALMPIKEFPSIEEQTAWFNELLPFVAKAFASKQRKLDVAQLRKAAKTVFRERTDDMIPTIFEEAEIRGEIRGEARGEARGQAIGEVRALLRFLSARFRTVPKRVRDRISQIHDCVVLDSLTVAAATCQSLKEFEEALQ